MALKGKGDGTVRVRRRIKKEGGREGQGEEMAAPTVDELIANLSPDLQGLLDSRKVGRQLQGELSRIGVDNVAMLSAVATDRDSLQALAKDSLGLDVAGGGDAVIRFAQLYLAWQAATKRIKVQDEMDAEASAQKEPKTVPIQEVQSLKSVFENNFYKLKETETPAKVSLEDIFEQVDAGELRPMALRHFGSKADDEEAEIGNLQLGKAGQVKIRKSRVETNAPATLEDLRAKVVLMANHFLFVKFRYPNKEAYKALNPFVFLDYLGYLTGKHVAQMETQTVDGVTLHKPSVKLLLNYEYQMRKEVVDMVNEGEEMAEAFKKVTKNSDIRERHFSTPLAVSSATQTLQAGWKGGKDRWRQPYDPPKGEKGKGKKGKGKGKGKKGSNPLHSTTPDGRQICFAWNNPKEGCKGGCQRLHVCRICLDTGHAAFDHPGEKENIRLSLLPLD